MVYAHTRNVREQKRVLIARGSRYNIVAGCCHWVLPPTSCVTLPPPRAVVLKGVLHNMNQWRLVELQTIIPTIACHRGEETTWLFLGCSGEIGVLCAETRELEDLFQCLSESVKDWLFVSTHWTWGLSHRESLCLKTCCCVSAYTRAERQSHRDQFQKPPDLL